MKRIISVLLCTIFILVGCQGNSDDDVVEKEGVYYRKISDREISYKYNGGMYAHNTLYYDEHIYNSIKINSTEYKSELKLDEVLGDELGRIAGNNKIFWSTDKDKLFEVTSEGLLYKVKGYDDSFRVCVYYENIIDKEIFYHLEIYECLNDLTLDKGSELFKDIFRLESAVELKAEKLKKSDSNEIGDYYYKLPMDNSTVVEFLEAINEGEFISSEDENYPLLNESKGYSLIFTDNLGLEKRIGVFDSGYVTTLSQENYLIIAKVDKNICNAIISMVDDLIK